ncbi:helix-turn-helix domain-containing protein [Yinghuangia sp. ASG 101]|uniref:helix-turn-helix domain-containing protein n=1 Tax=Yinghuangia sp. ASG 101 TaxID=2896848 RepID=UPI001E285FFE|nr:helix-turn-helix domain-containing protein [Yinghuangia sp. ASG 101]UGQ11646.1 helix-turn-helix domain-containing protein [Yinghuangia sp. ASG 101]
MNAASPEAGPGPATAGNPTSASARRHTLRGARGRRSVVRPGNGSAVGGRAQDIDTWRSMLRECIVELDAAPVGGVDASRYTGWAYQLDLGPLSVTDVGTDPARVSRTPRMIGRSQDAFYHLSVAQRPCWVAQAGQETRLEAGDAVLLDCTTPFWLAADGFAHHLVVNIPRGELLRSLRVERDVLGRRIAAANPALRVLTAVIGELGGGTAAVPPRALLELGNTAAELLASTVRWEGHPHAAAEDARMSHRAQLLRMQDFVCRNLAEPGLSTQTLASAFGVSARYVEIVFRDADLTPFRFIRETRLDQARRMLADPRQRHRPIAAVGRSVGFENASVFARNFRARYGATPREYRQTGPRGD